MPLRNLTGHSVSIRSLSGTIVNLPPEAVRASARREESPAGAITHEGAAFPLYEVRAVEAAEGLPDPEPGTTLLVSQVTAFAVLDRADLVYPYRVARDDFGQPTHAEGLARISPDSPRRG